MTDISDVEHCTVFDSQGGKSAILGTRNFSLRCLSVSCLSRYAATFAEVGLQPSKAETCPNISLGVEPINRSIAVGLGGYWPAERGNTLLLKMYKLERPLSSKHQLQKSSCYRNPFHFSLFSAFSGLYSNTVPTISSPPLLKFSNILLFYYQSLKVLMYLFETCCNPVCMS